ncbi:MAG: hypothetical protein ABEI52_10380 [Halobacteriaceae archaeon]
MSIRTKKKNVSSEYPSERKELAAEITDFYRNLEPPSETPDYFPDYDDEDEVMQRLEELGYR